ncbi:hypothetical protein N7520_010221, partial [Penicillium odoratum]|uniref:uncharacterized protein n=1 Tax=Penicillium odoratum TaxID=1167516 RepID=UPI0025493C89
FSTQVHEIEASELRSSQNSKHIRQVHEILQSHGFLKINSNFPDESSIYLTQLISSLSASHGHGLPITHSSTRGWFWDVRPQPTAKISSPSSSDHQISLPEIVPARSETAESFPWHTDCSYEECPPQYFALQIIHADACGGGTLSVLELTRLLPLLSATARKYLSRAEYRINVPPEFIKKGNQSFIIGSVLTNTGRGLRFREDIITPLTTSAGQALVELKNVLRSPGAISHTVSLSSELLPSGSIVLIDNRRWLHGRSTVWDPMRHLRRVRWDAKPFAGYNSCDVSEFLVYPVQAEESTRKQEREVNIKSLEAPCPQFGWPLDAHLQSCPHPMRMNTQHTNSLKELHEALVIAINHIVERWWKDEEAAFPTRMPLEEHEERLLQWIDGLNRDEAESRPFKTHQGSWRPDFLIEEVPVLDGSEKTKEQFRICEINARFAFNGFLITAYGQDGLLALGSENKGFLGAAKSDEIIDGLFELFDPELPLHLLKGAEGGHDILMFLECAERRTGIVPRIISPQDLRLVSNPSSKTGYKLCSVIDVEKALSTNTKHPKSSTFLDETTGEVLEEINQVALELHQHELRVLSHQMIQHISDRCFNDFRSVFLVHDKRMLGIVHQELDSLLHKYNVLSERQAEVLRHGIVQTILPGSPELRSFIQQSQESSSIKDDYILKPVRGGKGEGILFGDDLSSGEWNEKLQGLGSAGLVQGKTTYVVQRQVQQPLYEVLLREEEGVQHNRLVGTYMSVNGKYLGVGCWRSGPGRVCAISHGGAWMVSVIGGK